MADRFPKAYVNTAKKDDALMKYVNGGDFAHMGIGARSSGMPKDMKKGDLGLDHVGGTAGGSK